MKRVLTRDLIPGMITGENIYTVSGQLILPENLKLTDKMIIRLEFYAVDEISVIDDVAEEFVRPAPLYSERISNSPEFKKFRQTFFESVEYFQNSINMVVNRIAPIDTYSLLTNTINNFSGDLTTIGVFDMLHNMRGYDDVTYHHSLSVAIICNIFGKWLGFSKEDTEVLMMPDTIIKKPERLSVTEYEMIKTHPFQGYNLLKKEDIDERIKNAALMHHERCDSSGYPSHLASAEIDDFAKIVAIADVYDAMTSSRLYRGPLCPFDVVHIFESEGLRKFEPKYLLPFLSRIVNTYMNNDVLLNNGETGTIVMINKLLLAKPVVKTATGFIDLSTEPELYITKIL
jgi:HD-GYP domain-containing protein (c-di-GMP phosphodiesterase class II)